MPMPSPSALLDELPLAFLDVETTGLSPRFGDRLCEIAIVRSRVDLIRAVYSTLVNPERSISPSAAAVNHLCDQDVCDAPRFGEIADTVLATLQDAVLVCHNAPFDLGFVASEMRRTGREWCPPAVLDTLQIARRCYSFRSNGLGRIAAALSIETPNAHRALGDALTTREVWLRFVQDFWAKGIRTLGELQEIQGDLFLIEGRNGAIVPPDLALPPTLAEALSCHKRLFITYIDGDGDKTERWVTPQQIRGIGEALSLVAFCHLRNERRVFRLDRITEMQIET